MIVTTEQGVLRGRTSDGVTAFGGVPYAAAPTGPRRFLAPSTAAGWSGERDATHAGPPCPQTNPDLPPWRDPGDADEDCLTLDVWTPATDPDALRPVIVWIHGGAYSYGSANAPVYDGAHLSRVGDLVVVSVNHRLNVFGYLWLGDLLPAMAPHANAGQQDLVAALRWVRANVRAFGGDPGNVTAFGESGGGAKIGTLLAMPQARGLVDRAIVASGSQLRVHTRESAGAVTATVLDHLGLGAADAGRIVDCDTAALVAAAAAAEAVHGALAFQPVVDEVVLPHQPWADGAPDQARHVPLLVGTTSHETVVFLEDHDEPVDDADLVRRVRDFFGSPDLEEAAAGRLVRAYTDLLTGSTRRELLVALTTDLWMRHSALVQARHAVAASTPVHVFEHAWTTPCFGGAWATHAGELPFVFGTLDLGGSAWDGTDSDEQRAAADPGGRRYELSEVMIAAWSAFARVGDPGTADRPWPAYDLVDRPVMVLDAAGGHVEHDRHRARRELIADLPTGW